MKYIRKILLLLFLPTLFYACKQQIVFPSNIIDFGVVADSLGLNSDTAYYFMGSKSLFSFKGNPFTITFYSGEVGHNYNFRSRLSAMGTSKFNFTTALNIGTQPNTLKVLLSTDFKGVVVSDTTTTIANISSATWNDITPSNLATNSTAVNSSIDLSKYALNGKQVFIAFKYTGIKGSIQNKWTITNVALTNTLADNSTYTIANLNTPTTAIVNYGVTTYSPGWVTYSPTNTKKWTASATSLIIDSSSATSGTNSESWTFLGSVDLTKVTPDVGVALKGVSTQPSPYSYIYLSKGAFSSAFLATNNSYTTNDTIIKFIPISIK